MVDALFAEPRLAEVYDPLDADRSDLDVYAALVDELGARSVLDVGCGTGTFACLLAERGKEVTGVDPAAASLAVARGKPGADRVRWLIGDATTLPPLQVDLVTMTGNVAQVFLTDEGWASTLRGARSALRPGGWLVFEVRDPARGAWRRHRRPRPAPVPQPALGRPLALAARHPRVDRGVRDLGPGRQRLLVPVGRRRAGVARITSTDEPADGSGGRSRGIQMCADAS